MERTPIFVLFCAWWYESVAVVLAVKAHDLVYHPLWLIFRPDRCGDRHRFKWMHRAADCAEWLVRILSLGELAWLFADHHLREKWRIETEEANRKFWAKRQAELRAMGL